MLSPRWWSNVYLSTKNMQSMLTRYGLERKMPEIIWYTVFEARLPRKSACQYSLRITDCQQAGVKWRCSRCHTVVVWFQQHSVYKGLLQACTTQHSERATTSKQPFLRAHGNISTYRFHETTFPYKDFMKPMKCKLLRQTTNHHKTQFKIIQFNEKHHGVLATSSS